MDFVKGIHNSTIPFDELALLATCHAYNIHSAVLLKDTWSMQQKQMFHDCALHLAYVADFTFKEISTENIMDLSKSKDTSTKESLADEGSDDEGNGSDNENLAV